MKFGIFYEHPLPRPWGEGDEERLFHEALEQVELADRLGIDSAREVEHHFLEEYSHTSAPEVFLAALGMGALTSAFVDPAEAGKWDSEYYEIVEQECVPIGHSVNANIAMVTGFSCHPDPDDARRRGEAGPTSGRISSVRGRCCPLRARTAASERPINSASTRAPSRRPGSTR